MCYHPQSDRLVERFNHTLLNMLSIGAQDQERDWNLQLPQLHRFGAPDYLHTDQGHNFESTLFSEICELLGVSKTRSTPFPSKHETEVTCFCTFL